ncbi:MAG: OmpA family protein, partial [Sneathia sanguinegens]|uniref:OmpA family protein n=1 Tax=Sneathia sanguinegens TaxID=40543 RepID=UPI002913BD0B
NTIDELELLKLQKYKNKLDKINKKYIKNGHGYIFAMNHYGFKTDDHDNQYSITVGDVYSEQYIENLIKEVRNEFPKKIANSDELHKLFEKYNQNVPNSKLTKVYQDEIDRLKKLEQDANAFITEKEDLIKGYKNDIENLKSLLNSENPSDVEEVNKQIKEKEEKIKKALEEIENLKKNLTEIKPGSNALAYGTNSAALGKDSIAFGTNNIAIKESSIAFGTNNFVNGDKSIALGYGHKIIGDKSVALGDPNLIYGDNNFAIGNDIKIGAETQKVNNNLVFGSNVTIDGINNAIVFGNESKAIEGAVSFGNDTTTRKLKYIAEGTDDTDAVNFSQLKDYVKKHAKVKAPNIKNEMKTELNYDPDTYLKIDETYLQYISGKKESPKIPATKKLSLNINAISDALGKDSDIANPINKFVTDQKVHDYVTENFVSKDSLGVTSKNNYISVNTNGNKYELSFNKDELIKNLDLTKNNTITTINTTLDDKLNKADLSINGDNYIKVDKDDKFNYKLSLNKDTLAKDLDLTNNTSVNNMFTTKLGDINTNIGDLKTKVESNTNNINSLTTKVDDNSNKISDLTTKVETNTNNINSLTTKVNTNIKDITTLKKDMANKLNVDADNLTTQGETNLINKLSKGSDISKPNNRLVTDTKVKQYLDTNFKIQNYVVAKEVLDIKKDAIAANEKAGLALGGVANAIAMANLTTTESGLANLTAAYGTYGKEHALAIGFNGTIPNKRFNYKLGLSTNMKGNLGIGAGIGIVLGKIDAQINKNINSKEIEQNKKIKDLEEKLKYMTDKLNDLTNKINDINFNENKKVETKPTKEETKETKLVIDDFDFDSYTLKEEQKQKLDKFFEKNDCKEIVIVGYTDNVGTDDYNLKLSEKRAKEVEKYLKAKNNNLEILTLGMGKGESLLKESKNDRRVEIFIQ